ncbi:MAG: Gfo/Idh/MocA family oxidoreductase, partial [Anaerolineae bacterium]|nr:Gfo/Idh/MocA family oxidoreductase [Anaerolineae bacterium]
PPPEKSARTAERLGLEVGYPDFAALLADPQVEGVHITTPNKTHFEMSKAALEAGKHVVCEKPLAMNAQESAALVQVARQHPQLISAVNYNIRFYPLLLHVRELIQNGALGELYTIRGAYVQDWLLYDTDWNWRLLPEEGGELRAVGDIGTHWMDLMAFLTGLRVDSLLADLATFVPVHKKPRQAVATFQGKEQAAPTEFDPVEIATEDWGAVLFRYANGARGSLAVSQVNAGRKNQLTFEIAGSRGAVAWNSERPNELWLGHRDQPNQLLIKDSALMSAPARQHSDYPGGHTEGFPDTFKQLYRAIYGYLAAGDFSAPRPFPTFEDGHIEVLLCEAILQSHRERRWVELARG